jgi:hypothetical protein
MSPLKYKLTEAAYIGEELFDSADYELERQCASVRHAEERKLMSREQALEIFEVSPEQYTDYLAKNALHILWPTDTTVINWVESLISLKAINATLIYFASRHHGSKVALKHLDAALRAMKKVTEEAEDQSRKTATTNLL